MPEIARSSAADRGEVDAEVRVEVTVLRGEHGTPHMRRKCGERARAGAGTVVGANVTEEPPTSRDDAQRGHRGFTELARERREERDDADEEKRRGESEEKHLEDAPPCPPHAPTPRRHRRADAAQSCHGEQRGEGGKHAACTGPARAVAAGECMPKAASRGRAQWSTLARATLIRDAHCPGRPCDQSRVGVAPSWKLARTWGVDSPRPT